jgi:hypothetical protein
MSRTSSPKRQRIDTDEVLPTQSASQVGSISIVDLSDRTTFTVPQGSRRSLSPMRYFTKLRTTSYLLIRFRVVGHVCGYTSVGRNPYVGGSRDLALSLIRRSVRELVLFLHF